MFQVFKFWSWSGLASFVFISNVCPPSWPDDGVMPSLILMRSLIVFTSINQSWGLQVNILIFCGSSLSLLAQHSSSLFLRSSCVYVEGGGGCLLPSFSAFYLSSAILLFFISFSYFLVFFFTFSCYFLIFLLYFFSFSISLPLVLLFLSFLIYFFPFFCLFFFLY